MTLDEINAQTDESLILKGRFALAQDEHKKALAGIEKLSNEAQTKIRNLAHSAMSCGPTAIYLVDARTAIDELEAMAKVADRLADVLAELKPLAWPKKAKEQDA